jgi:hypothetical protein
MRVIVARSNSPSKCKKQRPCQKAKCRSRNVRRQSVVARSGHSKGYLHFSPFPTETVERSPQRNAGATNCEGGARIHGDLAQPREINQSARRSNNRLSAPVSVHSLLRRLFNLKSSNLSGKKMHIYEVRSRKDHRGVDLISDALPASKT